MIERREHSRTVCAVEGYTRTSFRTPRADRLALTGKGRKQVEEECLFDVWDGYFGVDALLADVYADLRAAQMGLVEFLAPTGQLSFNACYTMLRDIELDLRRFVRDSLRREFGDDAWFEGVPERVRTRAAETQQLKRRKDLWQCMHFIDPKTIIDKLWGKLFSKTFKLDKREIMQRLNRLNAIRDDVYHPHEGQTFEEESVFLSKARRWLKSVVSRSAQRSGPPV